MAAKLKLNKVILCVALSCGAAFSTPSTPQSQFQYSMQAIPAVVQNQMLKTTWHKGCPVPLSQLSYLKLSYWGFDHKPHMGTMIVNHALALQVIDIFKTLYAEKFPIKRMQPLYLYQGNDDASLAANNTANFNCRPIAGNTGVFSNHAYGRAIDINPVQNPYVKGKIILPPSGKNYLNRNHLKPGVIVADDKTYKAFINHGWTWGGAWHSLKDYQHFEKAAEGSNAD